MIIFLIGLDDWAHFGVSWDILPNVYWGPFNVPDIFKVLILVYPLLFIHYLWGVPNYILIHFLNKKKISILYMVPHQMFSL